MTGFGLFKTAACSVFAPAVAGSETVEWNNGSRKESVRLDLTSYSVGDQLFKDTVIYGIGKLAPGLAGIISVIFFIKIVGAAEYGVYSLLVSTSMMWATLSSGWLNQGVLRYGEGAGGNRFYAIVIKGGVISSLIGVTLFSAALYFYRGSTLGLATIYDLVPYLAFTAITVFYSLNVTIRQRELKPLNVLRFEFIRSALMIALPLLLTSYISPTNKFLVAGVASAYLLSIICTCTGSLGIAAMISGIQNREREMESGSSDLKVLKKYLDFGWPLSVWMGVMACFQIVDRYLISVYVGIDASGQYAAIYDLVIRSYSLLFFPIVFAAHPRIMRENAKGHAQKANRIIILSVTSSVVIFIPVIVLLYFYSNILVSYLVPDAISVSAIVLPLSIGGFLWQVSLLIHKRLEMNDKTVVMLLAIILSLGINVLLNILLLPRYGVVGSSYAYILSSVLYIGTIVVASIPIALED